MMLKIRPRIEQKKERMNPAMAMPLVPDAGGGYPYPGGADG
jgi:hypothetical protein